MTIVYAVDKMSTLMNTDALVDEMVELATSATGSEPRSAHALFANNYRDRDDAWMVTARDDASSNKLVGTFGFNDLNKFSFMDRSKGGWRNTVRDAIVAKGIDDDANVDVSCAIYVHADYKGQNIASTMRNKRQEYQLNRGITHSLVVAPSTDNIKTWMDMVNTRLGGETIGTDSDGVNIYLCPHGTSL